jgi:hypothetical protein
MKHKNMYMDNRKTRIESIERDVEKVSIHM